MVIHVSPTVRLNSINIRTHLLELKDGLVKRVAWKGLIS